MTHYTTSLRSSFRRLFSKELTFSILMTSSTALATTTKTLQWKVQGQLSNPESVYFDPETHATYVSNVAGQPGAKDGNGFISKITWDKKHQPKVETFATGLNAPKGLRSKNGVLWVSDIDQVVALNLKTGAIISRTDIPGAVFLNDVAVDDQNRIYVSDTIGSKIYRIDGGKVSVLAAGEDLASPNGLLVVKDQLIVASWGFITDPATFGTKDLGSLYSIDLNTGARRQLTEAPLGHLDGLEQLPNGDFITSDWVSGKVYRVNGKGKAQQILEGIANSADIGLNGRTLLVPSMSESTVQAYRL